MANYKICERPGCGKLNTRGGNSKYCCGDCKMKADREKRKNKKLKK